MKIQRLHDLEVFLAVAQVSSFTQAAKNLQTSPIAVSAIIKRLEDQLQLRLFERSTRSMRLSAAGERYLPYARAAINSLLNAETDLSLNHTNANQWPPLLRMSLPSDLARQGFLQWLEDFFLGESPTQRVQLDLRVSDRVTNLLQQHIDFAVRYGDLTDSDFVSLPLHPQNRRVLCAAPTYLARHGAPQTLQDLTQHECLRFVRGNKVYSNWQFSLDGQTQICPAQGSRISDDAGVVRLWALAGLGIAYKSHLDVAQDIHEGRLVQLMPYLQGENAPLHLVAVSRPHITDKLRRLATYLTSKCQALTLISGT